MKSKSAVLLPIIKKSSVHELQIIQNKCLRIINNVKLSDRISISKLHKLANLETIEIRFEELGNRYLNNAISQSNPLIGELILEYKRFKGGRNLKHKTLLCDKKLF